jgi:hypothetical protein
MSNQQYPVGWDEVRVRRLLEHYETQNEEEAIAEDEAAFVAGDTTTMNVPMDLVPAVRRLIAEHKRTA